MNRIKCKTEEEKKVSYESDKPVTLKQGQYHQTCCGLVDPKHGHNNAKFEKPLLAVSVKKPTTKFLPNQDRSPLNTCVWQKERYIHGLPVVLNNLTKLHPNRIKT